MTEIKELEWERKKGIYNKPIRKEVLGTLNAIDINGIRIKGKKAEMVDKLLLLYNSVLNTKVDRHLDKQMKAYYELPEEKQIRFLNGTSKKALKEYMKQWENSAEYYDRYRSDRITRPAMLINDENDKTKTVIDSDYLVVKPITDINFPYKSCAEIMKDKTLSTSEKSDMVSRFLDISANIESDESEVEQHPLESIQFTGLDADETLQQEAYETVYAKRKTKNPREMFMTLKTKFPKDRTIRQLEYEGTKDGWIYTPILITIDPYEFEAKKKECDYDVNINYYSKSHFIKTNDYGHVYIIRIKDRKA